MKPRNRPSNTQAQGGFALVIALTLMAFVLVLLVSMTVLVNVETASSATALNQLRAKESARLALMMALGDLQRYAGPDQRVTARKDIYDSNDPYWTGVWDTTSPTTTPRWLVSWQDQLATASSEAMQLLGSGSVGTDLTKYVSAPVINISDNSGSRRNEIAWWISDESVKYSAGIVRKTDDSLPDDFFNELAPGDLPIAEQRQMIRQIGPNRHEAAVLFSRDANFIPKPTEDILNLDVQNRVNAANLNLERTISNNSLDLLEGITTTEKLAAYHDATHMSRALLTNTKLGGLKKDLTDRNFRDSTTTPRIDTKLMDFLWGTKLDATGQLEIVGVQEDTVDELVDGDALPTTPVIITECALYFMVTTKTSTSKTALPYLLFEAEFWSPFGFRHKFEGASGSDTPELIVEIEGLPDMTLRFYDKDEDTLGSDTILSFNDIKPTFEIDLTNSQKAGEIRKRAGTWGASAKTDKTDFYYTTDWSWTINDPNANKDHRIPSGGDMITYESLPSEITINVRNMSGDLLQRIENIPVNAINRDYAAYPYSKEDTDNSIPDTPSYAKPSLAPIAFSYRMEDSTDDLEAWFTEMDPRSVLIDFAAEDVKILFDINDEDEDGRMDADIPSPILFSNLDFLHGQINNFFFRLYDVPATIPYSVGALQHLQFYQKAPSLIGNSWGEDYNSIFDHYFISGIPQANGATYWNPNMATHSGTLPNPFLAIAPTSQDSELSELQGSESAEHLLIEGGFNINSTSKKAWESILGANNIFDWSYTLNKGTSSEVTTRLLNLESAIFRLPFSGHIRSSGYSENDWKLPFELYEEETSATDEYPALSSEERELIFRRSDGGYNPTAYWQPSASHGLREIDSSSIRTLAAKIVENLQDRGKPFDSIQSFLNSGLLQESIDATSINTIDPNKPYNDAPSDERMPRNISAFLSQADIISAIAPTFTTRGDTFVIRAGARTLNSSTNSETAEAYCEAIVQRYPERVTENGLSASQNSTGLGRKFEILDIKWINTSEL